MRRRFLAVTVAALAATAMAGCGDSHDKWTDGRPKTVSVEGIVTYNGKPVAGAQINFVPGSPSDSAAYAVSQADGKFALTTFQTGDGAPPGSYKVTVNKKSVETTPNPNDPSGPPLGSKEVSFLPEKYGSVSTTMIEVDVPETGTKDVILELKD